MVRVGLGNAEIGFKNDLAIYGKSLERYSKFEGNVFTVLGKASESSREKCHGNNLGLCVNERRVHETI
jgi:hypothetical protein